MRKFYEIVSFTGWNRWLNFDELLRDIGKKSGIVIGIAATPEEEFNPISLIFEYKTCLRRSIVPGAPAARSRDLSTGLYYLCFGQKPLMF